MDVSQVGGVEAQCLSRLLPKDISSILLRQSGRQHLGASRHRCIESSPDEQRNIQVDQDSAIFGSITEGRKS